MVEEVLVGAETLISAEKLIQSLHRFVRTQVECHKQPCALLLLIPTDQDLPDTKFSVLISAPWLDLLSPRTAVDTVLQGLRQQVESVDVEVLQQVARITVVSTHDPFVQMTARFFHVTQGSVRLKNVTIQGFFLESAILLEANRVSSPTMPIPKRQRVSQAKHAPARSRIRAERPQRTVKKQQRKRPTRGRLKEPGETRAKA